MTVEHTCPSCGRKLPTNAPHGVCPECLMKAGFPTGAVPGPGEPTRPPVFVPPTIAELAPQFPQLEILQLVGHGGMGAVYKARQPSLDRFVALKILPPQPESDTGFAERFNREARALARLAHPNIVAVHDFGRVGKLHYFIMEYVDGGNLRELKESGGFSPKEALKIIPQICEALEYAHQDGIVHRDIKPENIMLDSRGRVKITDFGLVKITGIEAGNTRLTGAKDVMGTPHYMAPEQIERPQEVDHRADIYSLGVVFYEMLTGELPLGRFAPPSRKVQIDVRLDEVVLHTLEKEPARRYQHASEVKTDVEAISEPSSLWRSKAPGRQKAGVGMPTLVQRVVARGFSILVLAVLAVFIFAEGVPAIGTQPSGVQINFLGLGLMVVGMVVGWKREGAAAVLIGIGWVIWHMVEPLKMSLLQIPAVIGLLYAYCWWAERGRRTKTVLTWISVFVLAFLVGKAAIPANVFYRGRVLDISTLAGISGAEFHLDHDPRASNARPNTRSRTDGSYDLYIGWHTRNKSLRITAPGFQSITTNLGSKPLWSRSVPRNFLLEPEPPPVRSAEELPPVVVETEPPSGADNVDPSISELRATFSRPMAEDRWSWVQLDSSSFPELTGQPRFLADRRTCLLPVKLLPGRTYVLWLNLDKYTTFQSEEHVPSLPYLLIFRTRNQIEIKN